MPLADAAERSTCLASGPLDGAQNRCSRFQTIVEDHCRLRATALLPLTLDLQGLNGWLDSDYEERAAPCNTSSTCSVWRELVAVWLPPHMTVRI
jgi:hypothetical protein